MLFGQGAETALMGQVKEPMVLTGTLVSFRDGWGLIESPSLAGKLFCGIKDNPVLQSIQPTPGLEVSFELGSNPKDGRDKAVNVSVQVKDLSQSIGQRVRGTVKRVTGSFGFASSPQCVGDVLLGTRSLAAAGVGPGALQVGDVVDFEISAASNGRFEGTNIQVMGRAQGPAQSFMASVPASAFAGSGSARDRSRTPYGAPALSGGPAAALSAAMPALARLPGGLAALASIPGLMAVPGVAAAVHAAAAASQQHAPAQTAGGQGSYSGTVRQFREHWGFIVSDQVQGDIYVNMRDNPQLGGPLQVGEAVQFELDYRNSSDRNNGARAVNVQPAGAAHVPSMAPRVMSFARPAAPRPTAAPAQTVPGGQHTGQLAAFKDGWGWLEAPTLQGQVFFGLKDNQHLAAVPNVGDTLIFEVGLGPKGRARAVNVQASAVGQRVRGTVKSLRDGWGFATVEGLPGNVMLGKKNLNASMVDGSALQVGEALDFDLAMGPKGYEASNITKA